MTSPRSPLIEPDAPAFYRCVSRVVKGAWLRGEDRLTKPLLEDRRGSIEQRLLALGVIDH